MKKREWIKCAGDLAYCIADRCAANVFDAELSSDERLDFMGMFSRSISGVVSCRSDHVHVWNQKLTSCRGQMEQQSSLYKQVPAQRDANEEFQATREFRLLEESKDIVDEVTMLADLSSTQAAVLEKLHAVSVGSDEALSRSLLISRPKARGEVIAELRSKANYAHKDVLHLIDMKQQQANILRAISMGRLLTSTNTILALNGAILGASERLLATQNELLDRSNQLLAATKRMADRADESGKATMTVRDPYPPVWASACSFPLLTKTLDSSLWSLLYL